METFPGSADREDALKIDLTMDEITVLRLLVASSMESGLVPTNGPEAQCETVGDVLLRKFDLALLHGESSEGHPVSKSANLG